MNADDAHGHAVQTSGGWRRLWEPARLSWWIAVLFMIGSALFALGGYAASLPVADRLLLRQTTALNLTFVAGSVFFTSAAWLQLLEAINCESAEPMPERRWRWWQWKPRSLGFLAALIQLAGTILFNVDCADAMLGGLTAAQENALVWTPDMLGCVCFLAASYLAFAEASHSWGAVRPRDLSWWIAVVNLLGSIAFQISAFYSLASPTGTAPEALWLSSVYTLVGAVCFLVGAYLLLPEMFEEPAAAAAG